MAMSTSEDLTERTTPRTVMYPDEGYSLENCDPIVTDSFQIAK